MSPSQTANPPTQHKTKRRGARINTHFETLYSHEAGGASAVLAELSPSGALLRCSEPWPQVGWPVSLYVWLPNQAEPSEITGNVVRHTGDGFAVEFEKPGQETCDLVEAASQLARDVSQQAGRLQDRAPEPAAAVAEPPPLGAIDLSRYLLVDLEAHAERVARAIADRKEQGNS